MDSGIKFLAGLRQENIGDLTYKDFIGNSEIYFKLVDNNSNGSSSFLTYIKNFFSSSEKVTLESINWYSITPIGTETNPFRAHFDGNGVKIKNIIVETTDTAQAVGVFGLTEGAEIKNVHLENVRINGVNEVGALVGHTTKDTKIINCYVSWNTDLSWSSVQGDNNVGALVGINEGSIDSSFAFMKVMGRINVGGLVGFNQITGKISNAYSIGIVTSNSNLASNFGGLVGKNQGNIENTYSLNNLLIIDESLNSLRSTGGLVGYQLTTTSSTTVTYSSVNMGTQPWTTVNEVKIIQLTYGTITGANFYSEDIVSESGFNQNSQYLSLEDILDKKGDYRKTWSQSKWDLTLSKSLPILKYDCSAFKERCGTNMLDTQAFASNTSNLILTPPTNVTISKVANTPAFSFNLDLNAQTKSTYLQLKEKLNSIVSRISFPTLQNFSYAVNENTPYIYELRNCNNYICSKWSTISAVYPYSIYFSTTDGNIISPCRIGQNLCVG